MKTTIAIGASLFLMSILNAQVNQEWVQRYGAVATYSAGHSIALDDAGNIYVTGRSMEDSLSGFDYATLKYSNKGIQQWVQRYSGSGKEDDDYADFLAVDSSGNVYVSGSSMGNGTGWDYVTIKYNTNGVQQWVQRYNGIGNGEDYIYAMGIDKSGNVYVTGSSYDSIQDYNKLGTVFTTIKYNSIGTQQWVKKYHAPSNTLNPGDNYVKALTVDNSGNVYVTGQSMDEGGHPAGFLWHCITIKYNSFGDSLWVARYCDPDSNSGSLISPVAIAVNNSGYVFVTGLCQFNNLNGLDYFTIKYNSTGQVEWVEKYNGPADKTDQPSAIAVDVNNVYVTGLSMGITTGYDYATVKYDFSGVQQWVQRYNGPGNGADGTFSIKVDASGNSYITGISVRDGNSGYCDFATVKYDYFGNQKWLVRYNGIVNEASGGYSLALNSSGDVFVTGVHSDTIRGAFTTIKYSQTPTGINKFPSEIPKDCSLSQNYPNPFNPTTTIGYQIPNQSLVSLKIFDLLGREVAMLVNEKKDAGNYSVQWNASSFPSGIYFYNLQSGNFIETKKLVLLK